MKRALSLIFMGLFIILLIGVYGSSAFRQINIKDSEELNENTIEKQFNDLDYDEELLDRKMREGQELTVLDSNEEEGNSIEFFYKKPEISPTSIKLVVYKGIRTLELYGDGNIIGRFKIALSGSSEGDKNKEGDRKTPLGEYYICTRNNNSSFCLFLGISYPNVEDAQRGLDNELIDMETFKKIKKNQELGELPPWETPLGGAVGIHGGGNGRDWTLGCIALEDEDVKIIWEYARLKTPIIINQ